MSVADHHGHAGNPCPLPRGYLVRSPCWRVRRDQLLRRSAGSARTNSAATWWKLGIPVLAVIVLAATHFHGAKLRLAWRLRAVRLHGIFAATSSGAVVFALLGFEQAVQFGGEARTRNVTCPARSLDR